MTCHEDTHISLRVGENITARTLAVIYHRTHTLAVISPHTLVRWYTHTKYQRTHSSLSCAEIPIAESERETGPGFDLVVRAEVRLPAAVISNTWAPRVLETATL